MVCLLLQQQELETKKNGGTSFADSSMHMDAVAWIPLGGEKNLENIVYGVFSQQRDRAAFPLASNVRNPHCNI